MANLRVTNHTPSINATGVFLNETIHVYFDKAIQPLTVTWETLSVNDSKSFTSVVGSLGVVWESGVTKEVTFTPEINFVANNRYNVYVFGTPQSILGTDGSSIPSTYSWEFTTGTGVYTTTGSGGIPSGAPPASGAFPDVSGIPSDVEAAITSFSVYSTDPQNQEPNVNTALSGIEIVFTGEVLTSLSDLSGYITIEETPVLQ